jgi:hypothetical protein
MLGFLDSADACWDDPRRTACERIKFIGPFRRGDNEKLGNYVDNAFARLGPRTSKAGRIPPSAPAGQRLSSRAVDFSKLIASTGACGGRNAPRAQLRRHQGEFTERTMRPGNGLSDNRKTRLRQELLSQKRPNGGSALEHQKPRLAALPQGSVGPCAVLVCPLAGVCGAAWLRRSFFRWRQRRLSGGEFLIRRDLAMSEKWFYMKGANKLGPVNSTKLRELAQTGELLPADLVWKEGIGDWKRARKIDGLFDGKPRSPSSASAPKKPPPAPPSNLLGNSHAPPKPPSPPPSNLLSNSAVRSASPPTNTSPAAWTYRPAPAAQPAAVNPPPTAAPAGSDGILHCPFCQGQMLDNPASAGQALLCPHCGRVFRMPVAMPPIPRIVTTSPAGTGQTSTRRGSKASRTWRRATPAVGCLAMFLCCSGLAILSTPSGRQGGKSQGRRTLKDYGNRSRVRGLILAFSRRLDRFSPLWRSLKNTNARTANV